MARALIILSLDLTLFVTCSNSISTEFALQSVNLENLKLIKIATLH